MLMQIFVNLDDISLLNLANNSYRFAAITKMAFEEKYADKDFVIAGGGKGSIDRYRDIYLELFQRFGAGIKAIKFIRVRELDYDHWIMHMIEQYTNRVERLKFEYCTIDRIELILSRYMNITDLIIHCSHYGQNDAVAKIPTFGNLRKLELTYELRYGNSVYIDVFEIMCHNPALETLILRGYEVPEILLTIADHLKHLKELHLTSNDLPSNWVLSDDDIVMVVYSLQHLKSLELSISNDHADLMHELGSNCKNIENLGVNYSDDDHIDDQMIEALRQFENVTNLKVNFSHGFRIPIGPIAENFPNLSSLEISTLESSLDLLSLLRKCKTLETIVIEVYSDYSMGSMNIQFFSEFIDIMQNRHGKIEFKELGELVGYVTQTEIVWRNKLMHWIGYDHANNSSNLTLLDLANRSNATDAEQNQCPFDKILGFLDMDSLHSLSIASKRSKQLVDEFVNQKMEEGDEFTITDEFHRDGDRFDMIIEHAQRIKLETFQLEHIEWLLQRYGPFPQVQHLVSVANYDFIPAEISRLFPKLETLDMKTDFLCHEFVKEDTVFFRKLKKITLRYEYHDENDEWEKIQEFFKDTQTELVPIKWRSETLSQEN